MSPITLFFTKIFFAVVLGVAWAYLTMYPIPHSDTVVIVIFPVLTLLINSLTKGLNPDAPDKNGASNAADAPSSSSTPPGETK